MAQLPGAKILRDGPDTVPNVMCITPDAASATTSPLWTPYRIAVYCPVVDDAPEITVLQLPKFPGGGNGPDRNGRHRGVGCLSD